MKIYTLNSTKKSEPVTVALLWINQKVITLVLSIDNFNKVYPNEPSETSISTKRKKVEVNLGDIQNQSNSTTDDVRFY